MSILSHGMKEAREDVERIVDRDPEMNAADRQLYDFLESIRERLGREKSFALELAISKARYAEAWASFRVGVTEGLRLANDVRSLLNGEGAVEDVPRVAPGCLRGNGIRPY